MKELFFTNSKGNHFEIKRPFLHSYFKGEKCHKFVLEPKSFWKSSAVVHFVKKIEKVNKQKMDVYMS